MLAARQEAFFAVFRNREDNMRKAVQVVLLGVVVAFLMTGCAVINAPMVGALYTDTSQPIAVGTDASCVKVGSAKCSSIIGITRGDASIDTAMKNGGIRKIHHVDCDVRSILGVYATYTTVVYGE